MPPPHASLVGGHRRWTNRGAVTVDAVSESYDPVTLANGSSLVFAWDCKALDAGSFEDATSRRRQVAATMTIVSTGVISLNTSAAPDIMTSTLSVCL
ncbi:hypothetical protein DPMN_024180 [Dreissena polymorpha]|uniref:Uncharacterized protein n=1 Tax=Dreissena polymorpha TaxID=45954 RepID=A0A9D4RBD2_DREPO|nr:hypothetical protein DPMN_024180 [Dreissena polymorpha]